MAWVGYSIVVPITPQVNRSATILVAGPGGSVRDENDFVDVTVGRLQTEATGYDHEGKSGLSALGPA